ncbi:SRPBCC domain-containing protein [Massilia eburnea]|uniref:SRPBCC domain-containing protein n=1 Tax=Massilia eburnea TaxID=1776165 RepID=UPI003D6B1D13
MPEFSAPNEIRIVRTYDAPVQAVWDAWTDPAQVAQWWGPRGFTLTTHSKDLRIGGTWRYTMHGPDGTDFPNKTTYHVVEPLRKLVYDHGATDDTPATVPRHGAVRRTGWQNPYGHDHGPGRC